MANKTITSDTDMESLIATGLNSGENITINSGAVLTCTETPSVLIGAVTINQGELLIDGTNISSDNVINFVGEGGLIDGSNDQAITVNGQGKLTITGDWFNIGMTDGTNSQVIDLSTATGSAYWKKDGADFCVDVIPMIQIETGRRIDYDNATGTTPSVGDWIYLTSDRTVMGKVKSVGTGYLVVWLLTGSLSDNDAIQCRKVVDNKGADLQVSWTANVNNASGDIKESGVYTEFGNARSNGNNYITGFGNGYGGLVFHHAFQSTDLTLGGSTGGFKAPSGCNIRIPNVIVNTSSLVDEGSGTPYANGEAFGCATNINESEWYQIECSAGGEIDMSICNWGNAYSQDAQASKYDVEYSGFVMNTGSNIAGSKTHFTHVVTCQSTELNATPGVQPLGGIQDCVNGVEVSFCMLVAPRCARTPIGGYTSIGIDIDNCIYTGAGQGANQSTNSNNGYQFTTIDGGSMTNCMYFGNDNAEQDYALSIATSPNITIENIQISTTQDYSEQTQEKDCIRINNSSDLVLKGVEFIGEGTPGNNVITVIDQSGLKIRAIGMIDDKVDLGVDGELAVSLSGLGDRIDIARCWFDKSSTVTEEFITVLTTYKSVLVQNCSNKYLAEVQPSGGANTRFKGLHGGAGKPGGSTGWEDAYVGSYGNQFHDGFQSDTEGTIACLMITPSAIADQTTIVAGNPLFFKDGDLNMANGDIIEFTQDYFALGHTGFSGKYSATTGTSGWFANEWSNVTLEFQYDVGSGWNGTWLNTRTPANLTGIIINPSVGVKLKHRFTATGNQNDMSMLLIDTTTTLTAQKDNFYPIDQDTITVQVKCTTADGTPISGARVYLTKDVGGDVILNGTTNASGIIEDTEYIYTADEAVSGWGRKSTSAPFYKQGNVSGTIVSTGLLMTAVMVSDA